MIGGIHNALENPDESLNHYNLARKDLETLPTEQTPPPDERADWNAVLDLKLAQYHLRTNHHKQAQYAPLPSLLLIPTNDEPPSALLQQTLNHFQSQPETPSAQAHLARTLHWQSLVYEAQGSKTMSDAMGAAARHAYVGVREARAAVSSSVEMVMTTTPSTGDFDAAVEVWWR